MTSPRCWLLSPTTAAVLLALALCSSGCQLLTLAAADVLTSPLCGEVRGFAGEFNDHIHIPVGEAVGRSEALVLVARSFPLELGFLTQGWLQIRASYHLTAGAAVNRSSDDNGILVLSDVAMGTDIEVRIIRLRRDGPVPFRFFSLHANNPSCFVSVTPDNSFYAPIPRQIRTADDKGVVSMRSATYFFRTQLSPGRNAVSVSIASEKGSGQEFFYLPSGANAWETRQSGDIISSSTPGDTLLYSFTPEESGQRPYVLTTVRVEDADLSGTSTSAPGTTGGPAPPVPPVPKRDGSLVWSIIKSLLYIVLIGVALALVLGTYYNMRVRGIHDFPEMVLFHEYFQAAARAVQLCLWRVTGRRAAHLGSDYNPVDGQDYYK